MDDLISLARGRNVCASLPQEHAVVSLEKGFSWNPEVIVVWYNKKRTAFISPRIDS